MPDCKGQTTSWRVGQDISVTLPANGSLGEVAHTTAAIVLARSERAVLWLTATAAVWIPYILQRPVTLPLDHLLPARKRCVRHSARPAMIADTKDCDGADAALDYRKGSASGQKGSMYLATSIRAAPEYGIMGQDQET